MENKQPSLHRPDIDGLRGVAVAAIVLFHLSAKLVPGGFVGVDVFFVISGFLISQRMSREMTSGSFTFGTFYKLRIRRIFPAAVVCIFLVMCAAMWLMTGIFQRQTIEACMSSVVSGANVYFCFFVPTGYFDPSSELNPVLHLWSLAVEEQFYIIWPFVMMGLMRMRKEVAVSVIGVVIVVSTIAAQVLLPVHSSFAYYMLPTRAGELAVGALLVFAEPTMISNRYWIAEGCGVLGAGLILGSCFVLNSASGFPGVNSLLPCAGSALVIAGGFHGKSVLGRVLSWTPVKGLGLISYSLYLYHWPILAFLRYVSVDLSGIHGFSALLYILAASVLSYTVIEQPWRAVDWQPVSVVLIMFFIPTLLVCGTGALFLNNIQSSSMTSLAPRSNSSVNSTVADWRSITMTRPFASWANPALWAPDQLGGPQGMPLQALCSKGTPHVCMDVCEWGWSTNVECPCVKSDTQCWFGARDSRKPPMLLLGDSNAAHYIGVLEEFAHAANLRVFVKNHPGNAPFIFEKAGKLALWSDTASKYLPQFKVVILAAQWLTVPATGLLLPKTVKTLISLNKTVILLGQVMQFPNFNVDCPNAASNSSARAIACSATFRRPDIPVNRILQHIALTHANVLYWDVNDAICPGGLCSPYHQLCLEGVCRPDEPRLRMYMQMTHLGYYGSKFFGDKVVRTTGVPWEFLAATAA